MSKDIAIEVKNLSKKYLIGAHKEDRLRYALSNVFKREKKEEVWALKDVSFTIKKGEVVGIIGKNGAGKSTLLKILSKITRPTSGEVTMYGRVSSLLEVGTGFHHELTGRENIFLNGSLLGLTRQEIKSKLDEIIDFSGIDRYIDTPVKHYSSGMYVRLAFAVAAHLEPEILLIDEVLAVGDYEFQQKCLGKMDDVARSGRTVVVVSHNMGQIEQLATTGILVDNGQILYNNSISETIFKYKESLIKHPSSDVKVESRITLISGLNQTLYFDQHGKMHFDLGFRSKDKMKDLKIDIALTDAKNTSVLHLKSDYIDFIMDFEKGLNKVNITMDSTNLLPGHYSMIIYIANRIGQVLYWIEQVGSIIVRQDVAFWKHGFESNYSHHLPKFKICKC